MALETYLCDGKINYEELKTIDWTNNILTLGFFLGINDRSNPSYKYILETISAHPRLNPSFRIYSLMRLLEILINSVRDSKENNSTEGDRCIQQFETISTQIFTLKSNLGDLTKPFSQLFTRAFTETISRFNLNGKIVILGVCGHRNKELLTADSSIMEFSIEELEKINTYEKFNKYETLEILVKGCEIILTKKYRGSEPLSIIVYNTLVAVLSNPADFTAENAKRIEEALLRYKDNFTPKQKSQLLNKYLDICKQSQALINEELRQRYTSESSNNRNYEDQHKHNQHNKPYHGKDNKANKRQNREYYQDDYICDLISIKEDVIVRIKAKEKIHVDGLSSSLIDVSNHIGTDAVLTELEKMAMNEHQPNFSTSLYWKLISKAISISRLYSHNETFKLNEIIDSIVKRSTRR